MSRGDHVHTIRCKIIRLHHHNQARLPGISHRPPRPHPSQYVLHAPDPLSLLHCTPFSIVLLPHRAPAYRNPLCWGEIETLSLLANAVKTSQRQQQQQHQHNPQHKPDAPPAPAAAPLLPHARLFPHRNTPPHPAAAPPPDARPQPVPPPHLATPRQQNATHRRRRRTATSPAGKRESRGGCADGCVSTRNVCARCLGGGGGETRRGRR